MRIISRFAMEKVESNGATCPSVAPLGILIGCSLWQSVIRYSKKWTPVVTAECCPFSFRSFFTRRFLFFYVSYFFKSSGRVVACQIIFNLKQSVTISRSRDCVGTALRIHPEITTIRLSRPRSIWAILVSISTLRPFLLLQALPVTAMRLPAKMGGTS